MWPLWHCLAVCVCESFNCSPRCRKHFALCWTIHKHEKNHHLEHLGWCYCGFCAPRHGLDRSHWQLGRPFVAPRRHPFFVAAASLYVASVRSRTLSYFHPVLSSCCRYMARVDYTNGGYKMLSCSDPRAAADTAVRHALAMSAMLFALPTVLQMGTIDPSITHTFGTAAMYGAGCSGLVWAKIAHTREITMEWAKKTFLFSLLVVPIIMAAGAVWWLVYFQTCYCSSPAQFSHTLPSGDTVSHTQNGVGVMPA